MGSENQENKKENKKGEGNCVLNPDYLTAVLSAAEPIISPDPLIGNESKVLRDHSENSSSRTSTDNVLNGITKRGQLLHHSAEQQGQAQELIRLDIYVGELRRSFAFEI